MSEPQSTNQLSQAHLAAALRPAFRCPTVPTALRALYDRLYDNRSGTVVEPAGASPGISATEAALRAVIILRSAIETPNGRQRAVPAGATIDVDDSDPDIGLHLALYSVETLLDQFGWQTRDAA